MMGLSGGVSSVQLHDACVLRALALYHVEGIWFRSLNVDFMIVLDREKKYVAFFSPSR